MIIRTIKFALAIAMIAAAPAIMAQSTAKSAKSNATEPQSTISEKDDERLIGTAAEVSIAYSSKEATADADDSEVFTVVEQMPAFPGGEAALLKFICTHLIYPETAAINGVEGRVIVRFVVTKTGYVGQVEVARSVDPYLDAEAVRVVKMLPRFTPGKINGQAVNTWYTLPISFKLQSVPQPESNK